MINITQAPWRTKNKGWPLLLSLAPKIGSGTEVIEVGTGATVVRRRTEQETCAHLDGGKPCTCRAEWPLHR